MLSFNASVTVSFWQSLQVKILAAPEPSSSLCQFPLTSMSSSFLSFLFSVPHYLQIKMLPNFLEKQKVRYLAGSTKLIFALLNQVFSPTDKYFLLLSSLQITLTNIVLQAELNWKRRKIMKHHKFCNGNFELLTDIGYYLLGERDTFAICPSVVCIIIIFTSGRSLIYIYAHPTVSPMIRFLKLNLTSSTFNFSKFVLS